MTASPIYCDSCGATNPVQAIRCVACNQPLYAILPVGTGHNSQSTVGKSHGVQGPLSPGHLLQQRYSIAGQVGTGGFGAVYKAQDTLFSNRSVAIKEVNQDGLNTGALVEAIAAFQHEVVLLASLRHPNLPRIYGQFAEGGRYYVVMDFIEGDTLEDYLSKVIPRLPVLDVLNIGIQLSSVLDYLHTRQPPIIFRDVKPDNIMRASNGHIYLIDFGIARYFKPGKAKDTIPLGSKGYAAPEQYGKAQTTPQTDIYGLGATLHQLLTGDDPSLTPFHFESVTLRQSPLSAQLDKLLEQMLAMDMSKRPASMSVVKHELEDLLAKLASQHLSSTQRSVLALTARRRFLLGSVKVLAAFAAGAATTIILYDHFNPSPAIHPLKTTAPTTLPSTPTPLPAGNFTYLSAPLYTYYDHRGAVTAVAWSPGGNRIASAGSVDNAVRVWNPATGDSIFVHPAGSGGTDSGVQLAIFDTGGQSVDALAWSPDSTIIASALDHNMVQAWSLQTGGSAFTLLDASGIALAYSPDGKRIAAVSRTSSVQIWSIPTGQSLVTYRGQGQAASALAWSPDGKRIATGGVRGGIKVWDAATGKAFRNYSGHKQAVSAVSWSSEGKYIASSSADGTVQIWNAGGYPANRDMGSTLFTFKGHTGPVRTVAWAPGNVYRLASLGADATVQVWSVAPAASTKPGQALVIAGNTLVYRGHSARVLSVSWSPDGRLIASASEDGTVQIWQAV